MKYLTISEVSKNFGISTRMLRYYEKIGILNSGRKEDYAYRVYNEEAIKRLQQIILLRKLNISLKQISLVLEDSTKIEALKVMKQSIEDLNNRINALNTIRNILNVFVSRLDKKIKNGINVDLLEDDTIIDIVNTLSLSKTNLKEELSMEKLNETQKLINSNMNVRIIYLPPATVASSHFIGDNPEDVSGGRMEEFIKNENIFHASKDSRLYGFNNPSPTDKEPYGYEFWVTIPENLDVKSPIVKKQFKGGLYAAYCIKMGDFHEWGSFYDFIKSNEEYEIDVREPLGMGGCLEEHLNAYSKYTGELADFQQIDLLIPIKKKQS